MSAGSTVSQRLPGSLASPVSPVVSYPYRQLVWCSTRQTIIGYRRSCVSVVCATQSHRHSMVYVSFGPGRSVVVVCMAVEIDKTLLRKWTMKYIW